MKNIAIVLLSLSVIGSAHAEEGLVNKTGDTLKKDSKVVGHAVEKGMNAAGNGIKKGGNAAVSGIKEGGRWVGKELDKAGKKLEQTFK